MFKKIYEDCPDDILTTVLTVFTDFDLERGQDRAHQAKLLCDVVKRMG